MTTLKTKNWPWFALAALIGAVGLLALDGPARGMTVAVCVFTFLGACIRTLASESAEDVARIDRAGIGLFGGF